MRRQDNGIHLRLRELEQRIDLKFQMVHERLHAHEEQEKLLRRELTVRTDDTKQGLERRLEGMNEFRAQLERQAGTLLTRERFDVEHQALVEKVEALSQWKAGREGQNSRAIMVSIVAAIVALLGIVVGIAMRTK
jgi:hypothetical protein